MSVFGEDPHLNAEERARVLNWLEDSRREFSAFIDGVSDAQWSWKPAPEQWSIGETAEHIVLAEALLFSFVQRAIASARNPAWEEQSRGKTELIERVMANRSRRAHAPEPAVPRQGLTCDQVRERFERQRAVIEKFATETHLALHEYTAVHPFAVFGTLNAYQWLVNLALHTMRHDKQIAKVKATPGYPEK